MIEKLCRQIEGRERYIADYEALSRSSSLLFLKKEAEIDIEGILRLLKSATAFSLSVDEKYRKQAYSIAIMAKNVLQTINFSNKRELEAVIALILSRLGNFPAEKKFAKEVSFDESILPPTLRLERAYHYFNNQVNPSLDKLIVLTDFQCELWNAMQQHKVVIVNAPTSSGKSFVLQNYVINAILSERLKCILYIVPSRALIEQVMVELKGLIQDYSIESDTIHITEIPHDYSDVKEKIIYVLTQERAQLLLETKLSVDLLIIDEAQNIADEARGIILQSVVESIINRKEDVKIIFAMPFVKNPEVFLSVFDLGEDYVIIPTAESPVKQNLYNIVVDARVTNNVRIEHVSDAGTREYLCDIHVENGLISENRYLAILSVNFGKGQNNIVFGSEPGKCEKLSSFIIQLLEKKEDEELLAFSEFLKEHIHKDFLLAETIKFGVAYHYGALPSFIRKEIERLTVMGKINYIVCTSTLLQGVNLPAQNIFIMKPSKGRVDHKPGMMSPSEFWNLIGRAGRLTKDYEGNVFLINIQDWERRFIDEHERQQPIYSAYNSIVSQRDSDLLQFISDHEHPSGIAVKQGYENAFMKLLDTYMIGGSDDLKRTLEHNLKEKNSALLVETIEKARSEISLPHDVLMLNPNVSAYRQQEMLDYMKKKIDKKGVNYLIPPHPMQNWGKIEDDYIRLFVRFGKHFKKDKKTSYLAIDARLALKWMRGSSYAELLADQLKYKKSKRRDNKDPNVNTEARDLFKTIDSKLRFEYVKFTKCYNDLLYYLLSDAKNKEKVAEIPPLHLFLEIGACSGTMISLIGLGISRTSAGLLTQKATKTGMDEREAEQWLRNQNLKALDIPDTVINEVKRILG